MTGALRAVVAPARTRPVVGTMIEIARQIVIVRPEIDDPALARSIKNKAAGIGLAVQEDVFRQRRWSRSWPRDVAALYRKINRMRRQIARPGVSKACEIVTVEDLPGGHLDPARLHPRPLWPYYGEWQIPAVILVDKLGVCRPTESMREPGERRHIETR